MYHGSGEFPASEWLSKIIIPQCIRVCTVLIGRGGAGVLSLFKGSSLADCLSVMLISVEGKDEDDPGKYDGHQT